MPRLAVIGGGPGGLYAAREAARQGFAVTVFEKSAIGENIVCAEGFFDPLKLLTPPITGVRCRIREVLVSVRDTFTIDSSKPHMWMIDRKQWQQALAAEATELGCAVLENSPVLPQDVGRLTDEFDWVIDASGVQPASRAHLNLSPVRCGVTAQYTLKGNFSTLWGKLKIAAEPHYCGYYWIFPKTKELANVGVGWFGRRPNGINIHQELKRIIKKEGLAEFEVLRKTGGPVPVTRRKQLVYGKILLVGDAAGLCSPLHGGGIDTACISGILAIKALAKGKAEQYQATVEKILDTRLKLEQKIIDVWEKSDFNELNELLKTSLGSAEGKTPLKKVQQAFSQEAVVLRYILEGRLHADWDQGIQLDGLPLLTKIVIRKIMNGDD